jgi:chromosome segregation ATPase
VKKKTLKKKEIALRIGRLIDQYSDLNNRLNRVSHDKLNQGLQLDELSQANAGLQQRYQEMQRQIEQITSREEELDQLLETRNSQLPDQKEADECAREKESEINYLSDHLAFLHEQQKGFIQTLEQESQASDVVANTIDDLRRDISDLLSHIRRLEESGSELLVSDDRHESEIQRLQHNIAELDRKLNQGQGEREATRQEVSSLIEESVQTLRHELEHIRQQLADKGGQQKALERHLSQAEQDMQSQLADQSRELSARIDTLNEALREQAAKRDDLVNHLDSDLASQHRDLQARIASIDVRLSEHIGQQVDLPDTFASISRVIDEQKDRFEATVGQLRQELSGLDKQYQKLDRDEHEAADWLSLLASGLDEQTEDRKRLEEAVEVTQKDLTRRVDEIKARLIIAERVSKEQDEVVGEQAHKLGNLVEEMAEQGRQGVDLKLTAATLQEDAEGLKEGERKLNEQLEALSQTQQQAEQKQAQILQQLSSLEQVQKAFSEQSGIGIDSLQERIHTAMTQLAEQSGLSEGLSARLQDLESSLQAQFGSIEARFQQLLDTTLESRESLALQVQESNTLAAEFTQLKSEHQGLFEQGDKQKTFLEAMTAEYGKRQEEAEQATKRLDLLDARMESTRSSGTHQGMAIGGLFLLLLLCMLLGYQLFTDKLGGIERDFSLALLKAGENYLTRQQIEQLVDESGVAEVGIDDSSVLDGLIEQQQDFAQRLDELEHQMGEPMVAGEAQPLSGTGRDPAGQIESFENPSDEIQTKQSLQQTVDQPKPLQERWQALRERGGYTIQLIGVSREESIAVFITKHQLRGELAYITTQREGTAWYILLHGMHDSYTEASKALQRLPESLRSQQPWVRKMPSKGRIKGL